MEEKSDKMITIIGPTACGKTSLATALADKLGAEIVSADSRQVYRRMDIGTGKDLSDYEIDGKHIPYHLIDIAEPGTKYNVFEYQHDFLAAYEDIVKRGIIPILCGGTGLYIEAVLKGYRLIPVPENSELRTRLADYSLGELTEMLQELKVKNHSVMHNTTDVDTVKRAIRAIEIEEYYASTPISAREFPQIKSLIIGLDINRNLRRERITHRLSQRMKEGMIYEIRKLIDEGIKPEDLMYYGLEYKYVMEYLLGKTTYEQMFKGLEIAIHQFAKRQMTWFRGMERRGFVIHWLDEHLTTMQKVDQIISLYKESH